MTPALAVRAAFACALACVLAAGVVYADPAAGSGSGSGSGVGSGSGSGSAAPTGRRPLAVVSLVSTDDPEIYGLAKNLDDTLIRSDQLQPVSDQAAISLRESYPDEDERNLTVAAAAYETAKTALATYAFADAAKSAQAGEDRMLEVTPNARIELRAQLRVVHGIALLADKPADAAAQFALAQRLAPNLVLDPARYLPEVVDAFAKARGSTDERVVDIRGSGRVWIDGREVGAAPGPFPLTVGMHVVQLAGRDRMTLGSEVVVPAAPAEVPAIAIDNADASLQTQIDRARSDLARASDAIARAGAMTELAKLVQVDDALLLSRDDANAIVFEVWHASTGFQPGERRPVGTDTPAKLIDIVAPPRPKVVVRKYPPPFDPPPPWYRERRNQVIAGTAVAFVLAVLAYSLVTHESTIGLSGMPMTGDGWSGAGQPTVNTRRRAP
jgi:hypothetical protein|nr:hypothetical protein [Kofleriaceae bacterium]